jgi:hypothetical protein
MDAGKRRQQVFFFEKKNQKTFNSWCVFRRPAFARKIKVFCFFSSEKKTFLSPEPHA